MPEAPLKLLIISGRSGSGKSTALHILEDAGFHCIDNLPAGLLPELVSRWQQVDVADKPRLAVSIDARNLPEDLERLPALLDTLESQNVDAEILFLDASTDSLITRYSETRRKHPLTSGDRGLREALLHEQQLLDEIAALASLKVDTTHIQQMELQRLITARITDRQGTTLALLFRSFAYKRGVPIDADYVFDLRCLPNPFWEPQLRDKDGRDPGVIEFLENRDEVTTMYSDIHNFLTKWIPNHEAGRRSYLTVGLGCTGGQHRSVYLAERLARAFQHDRANVLVRHRELA